jgi:hypothetical protein
MLGELTASRRSGAGRALLKAKPVRKTKGHPQSDAFFRPALRFPGASSSEASKSGETQKTENPAPQ